MAGRGGAVAAPADVTGATNAEKRAVREGVLTGERALFKSRGVRVEGCVFEDGESPLKESRDVEVVDSVFRWKYPLWYCRDVTVRRTAFLEMSRSGLWYTDNVAVLDSTVEAPKEFRRCRGVRIERTSFANAAETLWTCSDVELADVSARGDYFAKDCSRLSARNFQLVGNYCFDGGSDIAIDGARMLSKDSFWNCENVVVRNATIIGEYIGWNSRNLTFENCTIESLQGFCYVDGLTLRDCRLINTTRAFEYCHGLDVRSTTRVASVVNPFDGVISAPGIDEVVFDDPEVDRSATRLELDDRG
jgi:hypothetical protein